MSQSALHVLNERTTVADKVLSEDEPKQENESKHYSDIETQKRPFGRPSLLSIDKNKMSTRSIGATSKSRPPRTASDLTKSIKGPTQYVMESIDSILQSMVTGMRGKIHTSIQLLRDLASKAYANPYQAVEMYPRMPWYDVHGCVTGNAAKDLASHFVQVDFN
jgi:hypothetical protein